MWWTEEPPPSIIVWTPSRARRQMRDEASRSGAATSSGWRPLAAGHEALHERQAAPPEQLGQVDPGPRFGVAGPGFSVLDLGSHPERHDPLCGCCPCRTPTPPRPRQRPRPEARCRRSVTEIRCRGGSPRDPGRTDRSGLAVVSIGNAPYEFVRDEHVFGRYRIGAGRFHSGEMPHVVDGEVPGRDGEADGFGLLSLTDRGDQEYPVTVHDATGERPFAA